MYADELAVWGDDIELVYLCTIFEKRLNFFSFCNNSYNEAHLITEYSVFRVRTTVYELFRICIYKYT